MPEAKTRSLPDKTGHFGPFGGQFVPETVMSALAELERFYAGIRKDPAFKRQLQGLLEDYAGRPTPLYHAANLSKHLGNGHKVYLKREDLLHTGAHKINNALGQGLLAVRMKKPRIIAETGAGQHGVATATAAALLGLQCEVFMGEEDMHRQALNVFRMRLLGATVTSVTSGSKTLKDACNEAIRNWVTTVGSTHYCIGSAIGPHPYPMLVRDFQLVIGKETRSQILKREGRLPDLAIACVCGGSNAIGLFHSFLKDRRVKLLGVEAGGTGLAPGRHAASLVQGRPGVLHGANTLLLQDANGQVLATESVSAGLDYPGVGPEHAYLKTEGRVEYAAASDEVALKGCALLAKTEGILAALEPAHAVGYLAKITGSLKKGSLIVLGLSGRGDKDVHTLAQRLLKNDPAAKHV